MSIEKVWAREILDSRGNPTVEVDLYTGKGNRQGLGHPTTLCWVCPGLGWEATFIPRGERVLGQAPKPGLWGGILLVQGHQAKWPLCFSSVYVICLPLHACVCVCVHMCASCMAPFLWVPTGACGTSTRQMRRALPVHLPLCVCVPC